MVSEKMYELGSKRSVIREIFEFGKKRAEEVGVENVYDFSIGNPNVPAPEAVKKAILEILEEENPVDIHSYTSAQGDLKVRDTLAESINKRFSTSFSGNNLYMTVGAAASIHICFSALANPGDEFITFAPYFPEYRCFVEAAGGKLVVVPAKIEDFQIDFEEFEKRINEKTKAVIVNTPNNPSGVVYTEETITKLAKVLENKAKEYGHAIYLISDEPYREIAYDVEVPYLTKYYDNTFVCYSYSKSLSLPGERIGYIVVPSEMEEFNKVYAAICGAGRALGYVCAPSLFQKVVAKCAGITADISIYKKNRDLLYEGLIKLGYKCVKPEGAFYLFPQALEKDAYAFTEKAKKYDLLIVPGDDFGCPGHVRISYCVTTDQILRALPAFEKLAKEYK
ncbi:aspartate aminotransferase [Clostridium acetobutylicum]|uniref:Aminotransferase n=1 Tax=Clostridium acetobutylicum (strain ATCC 824 / DSM 792 / JCM 1419 / IAM 19013 / LMG 5710 / NBRC 13948 / NRRL B-527 / VKM B-1787 / 2291 / W) TaxID=272562 RepID=Q97FA8_CLOAB|nr:MULTISPECIES: pyridoxal phosphate-dependent aminotransferase [Clostridium]AAK80776.1 PLP-dependent aminotransferase [Clostridium acetobutylicum ATCC 824]ADZ21877.1 aspartate aminotransferase [Clostridium acetobutylicum EA 2018]AEI33076.1 aspartate aminotransferase [Clostridium acetobutylicum DSM 1731]AWV78811.1 pyridoxal phosphate-dependent aminotransferase [Clostridium acetobutylicum]MBC2393676.1 pyridoxal phosphate-dependent aminotransferase [Clostridium acetobutylicum]